MLRRAAARRQQNCLVQELIKAAVNCRLWVVVVVGQDQSGTRDPGGVDENATREVDKPGWHWRFVLQQLREDGAKRARMSLARCPLPGFDRR